VVGSDNGLISEEEEGMTMASEATTSRKKCMTRKGKVRRRLIRAMYGCSHLDLWW